MKLKYTVSTLLVAIVMACLSSNKALAGPVTDKTHDLVNTPWSPFDKGNKELEITGGAFGGTNTSGTLTEPDTDYALGSVRVGWMLNSPSGNGLLRGNFELLVGAFGGWIWEGPGDYLVGADLNLRYNFVQSSARFVPFFQIGAGGAYSDAASQNSVQRLIGSDWSWELQAALGFRYFLTERVALTASFQYQHFSNADANDRNHGLDALGGLVGLSWFF